jgi:hypothetical protein
MFGSILTAVTQPVASLVGAGIGAASSLIGGNQQNAANAREAAANRDFQAQQAAMQTQFQGAQTQAQMDFQADQTKQQMDFQERMRANQYQTTVADLKASGLNPMLAYAQGGAGNLSGAAGTGASASGASGSGAQAIMGNPLGAAGNSAKEAALAVAQYQNMRNTNVLLEEQAEKTQADRYLSIDQASNVRAQTARELAQMPGYGKFGALRDAQIDQLQTSSAQQAAQSRYTNELTALAKQGSAPSSQKPIYQDIKGLVHGAWDKFHNYPKATRPFGGMK